MMAFLYARFTYFIFTLEVMMSTRLPNASEIPNNPRTAQYT